MVGRRPYDSAMPTDASTTLSERLATARALLEPIVAETPEADLAPPAARAVVGAGLHTLVLPPSLGGLDGGFVAAVDMLSAVGAIDGSVALGLAMHTQVLGAAVMGGRWPADVVDGLARAVAERGALVNAASTEEGSGSPARGGLPATTATALGTDLVLTGEKTWTTWLPALTHAVVSALLLEPVGAAEVRGDAPPTIVNVLVELDTPGVERLAGFEALGMRGSASGRLRLHDVAVPARQVIARRRANEPDARGTVAQTWFGLCIAAVYLGIGEGARERVVRWAIDRRPGDGSTAVADIPSVRLRLGRIDAALRSARVVLSEVARRADGGGEIGSDLALAKLAATSAAVLASDEALRIAGGQAFLAGSLERAFRDARAGLINPPLEDVALDGFARALVEGERERARGGPSVA